MTTAQLGQLNNKGNSFIHTTPWQSSHKPHPLLLSDIAHHPKCHATINPRLKTLLHEYKQKIWTLLHEYMKKIVTNSIVIWQCRGQFSNRCRDAWEFINLVTWANHATCTAWWNTSFTPAGIDDTQSTWETISDIVRPFPCPYLVPIWLLGCVIL